MAEDQTDIPPNHLTPKTDGPAGSPSVLREIFFGPRELRAGWRLLIFLATLIGCFIIVVLLARLLLPPPPSTVQPLAVTATGLGLGLALFLAVLAAAFVMSRIEKRPMKAYGMPLRSAFQAKFWVGAVWGFVALTLLLGGLYAMGDFDFGRPLLHGPDIAIYGGAWFISFVFTGLFEEYLFRGYPQFTLTTGMGFWPSAIVLSIVFALAHSTNPGESKLGVFQIIPFAIFFCLTLRRTGSLWFAVGFHAAWDWGQSYFYGIADSGFVTQGHLLNSSFHGPTLMTGGSVGPEGSILILPLFVLTLVVFHLTHRKANYPDPEFLIPMKHSADSLAATGR
ncbi:MAG TPA: CPBP family intramembrane glutamic endopeptidase [Blastocatellia bacterium]